VLLAGNVSTPRLQAALLLPFARRVRARWRSPRSMAARKRKRASEAAAPPTACASAADDVASAEATSALLRDAILAILRSRAGSMCPSEAPRRVRPADWRCGVCFAHASLVVFKRQARKKRLDARLALRAGRRPLMDATREVARSLALDGLVQVTQRGAVLDPRAAWRGPIRLRLAAG
jgi:hypothetical protein